MKHTYLATFFSQHAYRLTAVYNQQSDELERGENHISTTHNTCYADNWRFLDACLLACYQ